MGFFASMSHNRRSASPRRRSASVRANSRRQIGVRLQSVDRGQVAPSPARCLGLRTGLVEEARVEIADLLFGSRRGRRAVAMQESTIAAQARLQRLVDRDADAVVTCGRIGDRRRRRANGVPCSGRNPSLAASPAVSSVAVIEAPGAVGGSFAVSARTKFPRRSPASGQRPSWSSIASVIP